jgi:hypothetical protein
MEIPIMGKIKTNLLLNLDTYKPRTQVMIIIGPLRHNPILENKSADCSCAQASALFDILFKHCPES